MPDTPIITDAAGLARWVETLYREPVIAVDLEADSMHSYREKVCLLQFSTPTETVLVDPLAGIDMAPLRPVMADTKVRKIFHAADYDIRCLFRDFQIEVRGLFDTMIACQFLGEERVGLADILGKYFGVELDKQYQRADWAKRPLTGEMIRYAAEDTRHLHGLVDLLERRLEEKGRLSWVAEEFELLEQVRHSESDGPLYLRAKGAGALNPRQLAILEGLLQWRDSEARRRDTPLFKVIGNRALMEIATTAPKGLRALLGIEGISPRLTDRYGKQILDVVGTALELPKENLPVFPRAPRVNKDPEEKERLQRLKAWRAEAAVELGMEPGIVINNALLEELSRLQPRQDADLDRAAGMKRWQRQILSEGILGALR